jgi:hypothetical protein
LALILYRPDCIGQPTSALFEFPIGLLTGSGLCPQLLHRRRKPRFESDANPRVIDRGFQIVRLGERMNSDSSTALVGRQRFVRPNPLQRMFKHRTTGVSDQMGMDMIDERFHMSTIVYFAGIAMILSWRWYSHVSPSYFELIQPVISN